MEELVVASKEQRLTLLNGYSADIKFDPFYKRWYYDLYQGTTLMFAGMPLIPDTLPLHGITDYYLGMLDNQSNKQGQIVYKQGVPYNRNTVVYYQNTYWVALEDMDEKAKEVPGVSSKWTKTGTTMVSNSGSFYEPYDELGGRLALIEVQE